jgi:hypothetical protein
MLSEFNIFISYNKMTARFKKRLFSYNYIVLNYLEKEKIYEIICPENHIFTSSDITLAHKLPQIEYGNLEIEKLCAECSKKLDFEELKREIFNMTGHTLLEKKGCNVIYKCGNCGQIDKSRTTRIRTPMRKMYCSLCRRTKQIIPYDEMKERIRGYGYELMTEPNEYTYSSTLLKIRCSVCKEERQEFEYNLKIKRQCRRCYINSFREQLK